MVCSWVHWSWLWVYFFFVLIIQDVFVVALQLADIRARSTTYQFLFSNTSCHNWPNTYHEYEHFDFHSKSNSPSHCTAKSNQGWPDTNFIDRQLDNKHSRSQWFELDYLLVKECHFHTLGTPRSRTGVQFQTGLLHAFVVVCRLAIVDDEAF